MNIRALLPFVLLSFALALSACGNKGPLLPPPAPDDEEWPVDEADGQDATDVDIDGDDPADTAGDDGDGDA